MPKRLLFALLTAGIWLAADNWPALAVTLVNKAGEGRVLSAHVGRKNKENGSPVALWELTPDHPCQKWSLRKVGKYYLIENAASHLVLDAAADELDRNGGKVQLWSLVPGNQNQEWRFKKVGDGYYKIINRANGKVLDAHAGDVDKNGCRIQLWEDNKGDQCLWRVTGEPQP